MHSFSLEDVHSSVKKLIIRLDDVWIPAKNIKCELYYIQQQWISVIDQLVIKAAYDCVGF